MRKNVEQRVNSHKTKMPLNYKQNDLNKMISIHLFKSNSVYLR